MIEDILLYLKPHIIMIEDRKSLSTVPRENLLGTKIGDFISQVTQC